jgi:hypothetical protein
MFLRNAGRLLPNYGALHNTFHGGIILKCMVIKWDMKMVPVHLTQDGARRWALVNAVVNLWVA